MEYRTDPARVAALLPAPLQPAPDDPGAVALIWADWQSCGDGGEELLDPVRAQYKECFAVVRCSFAGRIYSRCVYIWVDADFALARGLHQGYPKKLGSIHQTRPHPFGRAAPQDRAGRHVRRDAGRGRPQAGPGGGDAARGGPGGNGFVNAHPMAHHRWLPSIEKGAADALAELVSSGSASFEAGQAWRGDAELELFDSPTEELAAWRSGEIIGGYYRQVGVAGTAAPCWPACPRPPDPAPPLNPPVPQTYFGPKRFF